MAFNKEQLKLMSQLLALDGAVKGGEDPFASIIDTPSVTMNYTFDNTWGLPDGYSLLMGGPPKGGKSILISAIEGRLHQADPDAVTMKFNTEMRENVQVTPQQKKLWGIDDSRRIVYEVREPAAIFDRVEKEVPRLVQAGIKLRLLIIDSVNDIQGRRQLNAESVDDVQIADKAATLQDGFGRIKGILRNNRVSSILTTQIRSEMDTNQQKYGKGPRIDGQKVKLAVSWYIKHFCEFFMHVERFQNKGSTADLQGHELIDETIKNAQGDADQSAHKIRATMLDNSLGRPGRIGIFTLDHNHGIINTHEEIYLLGKGFGLFEEKGSWLAYGDQKWQGKDALLDAIKSDPVLAQTILVACKARDGARRG